LIPQSQSKLSDEVGQLQFGIREVGGNIDVRPGRDELSRKPGRRDGSVVGEPMKAALAGANHTLERRESARLVHGQQRFEPLVALAR
jgi:hypothetical protein